MNAVTKIDDLDAEPVTLTADDFARAGGAAGPAKSRRRTRTAAPGGDVVNAETVAKAPVEVPVEAPVPDDKVAEEAPQPPSIQPAQVAVPAPQSALQVVASPKKKRGLRTALMLGLPLLLVAGGVYYTITGGRYQDTENANLLQARLTITSQEAGRVSAIAVADNGRVNAGDTLFTVDPEPYRIALAKADAAVAAARVGVDQLRAAYAQAQAQEAVDAGDVDFYQTELKRQNDLTTKGVGTRAALESAQRDLNKARDQQAAASQSVKGALAGLGGDASIETDKHPSVLSALAARDQAAFDLSQTTVKAPADGVVTQSASFKVGEYVTVGTALFSLVETGDVWVDANFKETQLTLVKPGQDAEVTLDTFPDHPLKAKVAAIGAGTGAEFSLLPAQNATGNWVKVTQRIPVRLKIEEMPADLALRTGMSASVSVDTGKARGVEGLLKMVGLQKSDIGLGGTAHAAE